MALPNTPNYFGERFPMFQPAGRCILSISQGNPMVVTTTFDGINPGNNQYGNGLIVRLIIPLGFGMPQVNNLEAPITIISNSQFSMPIDSTNFNAFAVPVDETAFNATPAQVIPVGEINSTLLQVTRNVLPYRFF